MYFFPEMAVLKGKRVLSLFPAFFFLSFVVFSGIFPAASAAEAGTALIKEVRGAVKLTRAKTRQIEVVKTGDVLFAGDAVETLANSSVVIGFEEAGEIDLSEKSHWVFTKAEIGKEKPEVLSELVLGELRARARRLAKGSRFEIRTPTSIAAVRGTEFRLKVFKFAGRVLLTQLEVYVGTVTFSDLDETELREVNAGEVVMSHSPAEEDSAGQKLRAEGPGTGNKNEKEKILVKASFESDDAMEEESRGKAVTRNSVKTVPEKEK